MTSSAWARQRSPSQTNSNAQPAPRGAGPGLAAIGRRAVDRTPGPTGAIVIESLTGLVHRADAGMSTPYLVLMYIEETFELVAVAVAAVALSTMFHLSLRPGGLSLTFDGYRPRSG